MHRAHTISLRASGSPRAGRVPHTAAGHRRRGQRHQVWEVTVLELQREALIGGRAHVPAPGWGPGDPAALPGSLAQLTFSPCRFCGSHYSGGWRRGRTPIGRQMDQRAARRCPGQAGSRLPVNTAQTSPGGRSAGRSTQRPLRSRRTRKAHPRQGQSVRRSCFPRCRWLGRNLRMGDTDRT